MFDFILLFSKDQAAARQLLGIKGASENKNIWAIRLQLCKPVTWIPLIWGVACGVSKCCSTNIFRNIFMIGGCFWKLPYVESF